MTNAIEVNLSTGIATRVELPEDLVGLDVDTLRNLQGDLDPVPPQHVGIEYWPPKNMPQTIPAGSKRDVEILTANATIRRVEVSYTIIPKTAEELDLEAAVVRAKAEAVIIAEFQADIAAAKNGRTAEEWEIIDTLYKEVLAFEEDPLSPIPNIQAMATAKGKTASQIATWVKDKSETFIAARTVALSKKDNAIGLLP